MEDRLNQEKRNQSTGNELNQYKQLVFILNEKLTNLENQLNSRIQKEEKELMEETDLDELMFCGIEMPIDCPQSTQLGDEFQSWAGYLNFSFKYFFHRIYGVPLRIFVALLFKSMYQSKLVSLTMFMRIHT